MNFRDSQLIEFVLSMRNPIPRYTQNFIFLSTHAIIWITYSLPKSHFLLLLFQLEINIGIPLIHLSAFFLNSMLMVDEFIFFNHHRKGSLITRFSIFYIQSRYIHRCLESIRIFCFMILFSFIATSLTYDVFFLEQYSSIPGIPGLMIFIYLSISLVLSHCAKKAESESLRHFFSILSTSLLLVVLLFINQHFIFLSLNKIILPSFILYTYYVCTFSIFLAFLFNFRGVLCHVANIYIYMPHVNSILYVSFILFYICYRLLCNY